MHPHHILCTPQQQRQRSVMNGPSSLPCHRVTCRSSAMRMPGPGPHRRTALRRPLLSLGLYIIILVSHIQYPFSSRIHAFRVVAPLQQRYNTGAISYPTSYTKDGWSAYRGTPKWEGDDLRWISKIQRNIQRSTYDWQGQPVRNLLIISNLVLFVYQCANTIQHIQSRYPQSWSTFPIAIVFDTIMGNSRPGPFTLQLVHSNVILSMPPQQWYRFLSSGFLHGGLVHLLLNMDALRQLPSWVETGLGHALYLTTYLLAIVGGNIFHSITIVDRTTLCLGASGGICGLYGLMYVCLVRMGNHTAAWRVIRGMGLLFVWGAIITNISNAAHIGGFITGIVVGFLSGPAYRSSYGLRRKNSLEVDIYNRSYRTVMGYDKVPVDRGIVPLPFLWLAIIAASAAQFRSQTFL